MALTAKELTAIEDQLNTEKLLTSKCKSYAQSMEDPELRQKIETMAGRHRAHFEKLLGFLN